MKKEEMKERIEVLETENAELIESIKKISENEHKHGLHTIDHPFIPEYLGFTYTENRDPKTDIVIGRIYSKGGFNIAKKIDEPQWVVLRPDGKAFELLIENMLAGIMILRACGMDISIQAYYETNNQLMELVEKQAELGDKLVENEINHIARIAEEEE